MLTSFSQPQVADRHIKAAQPKLAKLAEIVGLQGASEAEKAKAFIASIRELNAKMDIPDKIEELREEDFEVLVTRAVKEGNPTYPVPVIWEKKEFEEVLKWLK